MEYLIQLLSQWTDNPEQLPWLFGILVGAATSVFILALLLLGSGLTDPLRKRIEWITQSGKKQRTVSDTFAEKLTPVSAYILPKKDWERSRVQAKLVHAGFRAGNTLTVFYGIKTLLTLIPPAGVVVGATFIPGFTTMQVAFAAVASAFVGMVLPNFVLNRRVEKRQKHIRNGFPDALDLLVTCTEAGLGLNAALQRVAEESTVSHPALAEELTLVNVEIRAGVERMEALRNLATRTGLEDIRGLVSLLSQSIRFGTSIADTLRVYAEEFRDKRMQRAEELAAKVGTKMLFPMIFCMFPAFFLVAIGPGILGVLRAFGR